MESPLAENKKEARAGLNILIHFVACCTTYPSFLLFKVEKFSLSNKKTRQFIGNLCLLIDEIFNEEEGIWHHDCWRNMIAEYSMAIEIL